MGKERIKCLLIQPHSDDVLFSCSHILFSDKYDCEVLTIENNPKRVAEDTKLYEFLNLRYNHLNVEFDDQSYYSFHKKYDEVTVENSYEHLQEFFGHGVLDKIESEFVSFLKKFKKKNQEPIVFIVPWGIGHPFHMFVRFICEKHIDEKSLLFYREFPHSYKKRSKKQVEKQQKIYELFDEVDVKPFADVKWNLAKKFYKTQSGLMFFEQGYINKQLPEEIYIKKK